MVDDALSLSNRGTLAAADGLAVVGVFSMPVMIPTDGYRVVYRRKIRYSDTDLQGVVFNGNYFTYFDDALTDYFEQLGLPEPVFAEHGHDITVAHAEADFRSAGLPGETLTVAVRVDRIGNTSLAVGLRVEDEATGRLVAAGQEVYVVVDRTTQKPVPVPSYLIAALDDVPAPPPG